MQTEFDFGEADAIEEAAEVSPANITDDSLDHDVLKATSSHNLFNDQESKLIGSRHVLLRGRPYNCVVTPWFEEFPDDDDFWRQAGDATLPCLTNEVDGTHGGLSACRRSTRQERS